MRAMEPIHGRDYLKELRIAQKLGVELDFDQHNSTELEMYQILLRHQDIKLKKMERLFSQLQSELEDNARFRLSWMAGAVEKKGGDE